MKPEHDAYDDERSIEDLDADWADSWCKWKREEPDWKPEDWDGKEKEEGK